MKEDFLAFFLPPVITGMLGFFLVIPITTYYLEPKDFGIFALLTALTFPLQPLSSTGVSWVLAGNFFKIDENKRGELLFNVALGDLALKFFWVTLFWILAPWFLPFCLREVGPQYVTWFRLALLPVFLNGLWPTVSYHLVLSRSGKRHALFEVLSWFSGATATVITLSVLGWKTEALFWSPIVAGSVLFLLNLYHLGRRVRMRIDSVWLREILTVGLPSIPPAIIDMLRNTLDRVFLERWLSLPTLGIYGHSLSYRHVFTVATKAFSRVFAPIALESFSRDESLAPLDARLNNWYILVGAAGIPLVFFAEDAIAVLTHGKFTEAAILVKIWFLLVLSQSFAIPYHSYLQAAKRTTALVATDVGTNLLTLALTIPAIFLSGPIGAAVISVGGNLTLQIFRKMVATRGGCRPFSPRGLWSAAAFFALGLALTQTLVLGIPAKIALTLVFVTCHLWISAISRPVVRSS